MTRHIHLPSERVYRGDGGCQQLLKVVDSVSRHTYTLHTRERPTSTPARGNEEVGCAHVSPACPRGRDEGHGEDRKGKGRKMNKLALT